ncbi:MAG: hypothetical protein H7Y18_02800 [Clostridiaceae bacterium]|nr:hypothetical protein [Clostridiaceae bacterium]
MSAPVTGTVLGNIATHATTISGDFTLTTNSKVVSNTVSVWDDFAVIFG